MYDLLPRETLIVLSYEFSDSPSIASIKTFLCGVKFLCLLSIAFTDHVTITFYEDVLRSVWCCLVSPIGFVLCVQEWTDEL